MVGVRYTTARHTAEQATSVASQMLGRPAVVCRTATTPLAGGEIGDYAAFIREAISPQASTLDAATGERLARLYGTEHVRVRQIAHECPALARPLGTECPTLGAEVLYAVREEMAVHLTDALLRRTDAGSAGHPGADALEAAARLMGDALDWNAERCGDEIAAVERTYGLDDAGPAQAGHYVLK
jgi:glycerol-3-phosphate dehydrogenase